MFRSRLGSTLGWRIAYVAGFVLVSLGLAEAQLWGPPKANLWPRWEKHNPADTRSIDHGAWDRFLAKYLDGKHPSGINRMNYKGVTPEDRKALDDYVARLQAVPISGYNRNEQRAYWINLYNARTAKVILDNYPVASIRKVKPTFLSLGPWDSKMLTVEGEALTLNDVEHRILRPIWKDPRIHYNVNCASMGCPNLAPVAYTAENLDRVSNELAAAYVNHPRGAGFSKGRLKISSIYEWWPEDFGGSRSTLLDHLKKYAKPELAKQIETYDGPFDHDYDWALNE